MWRTEVSIYENGLRTRDMWHCHGMSFTGCYLSRQTRGNVWGHCPPFQGHFDRIMSSFLAGGPDVQKDMNTGSSSTLLCSSCPLPLIGWNSGSAIGMQSHWNAKCWKILLSTWLWKKRMCCLFSFGLWTYSPPSLLCPVSQDTGNFTDCISGLPRHLASNGFSQ